MPAIERAIEAARERGARVVFPEWDEPRVAEALAARDRQALGLNAPPHGLYFVRADYPAPLVSPDTTP